jgi:hypothetical protein
MTDQPTTTGHVPAWYWVVAVAGLLFELAGCYAYYLQVTVDPASMALDQQALAEAMPAWILIAYGLAVAIGLIGAIGLLLRHRFAASALLVSLIAIVVQFGGILIVPELRQSMSSDQFLGPLLIFLIAYGLWHFARLAARRGWIR